jgi:hypothetical protein
MPVPPQTVRNNAREGLRLREEHGRGGTAVGVARARDLANGRDIPRRTLTRMRSFFARHGAQGAADAARDSAQFIAWQLWGGSAGRRWVESELKDMEKKIEEPPCGKSVQVVASPPVVSDTPEIEFEHATQVLKVDDQLGIVFGFAIVSKVDGEDYFDVQGDHIPEDAMLKAADDFMRHSRVAKEMHRGDQTGDVVFAFPLTTEIAKALDIQTKRTGLLIGMRPGETALAKFRDGTYTGFSIGGSYMPEGTPR